LLRCSARGLKKWTGESLSDFASVFFALRFSLSVFDVLRMEDIAVQDLVVGEEAVKTVEADPAQIEADNEIDWAPLTDLREYQIHRKTKRVRVVKSKRILNPYRISSVRFSFNGKSYERSVNKLWLQAFGGETMEGVGGEWRRHPDGLYPTYLFSSKGRVWHETTKGMLKGNQKHGYVQIRFVLGQSAFPLHDLMAQVFLGPRPTPAHTANHIDTNGFNNDLTNLEWASKSEQILHNFAMGQEARKLRVAQYSLDGETLFNEFDSFAEASASLGKSEGYISIAIRLRQGIGGGYLWKRIDEDVPCVDLEGEVWRPLFVVHRQTGEHMRIPDNYVSQLGRVRKHDMLRSQTTSGPGYPKLGLRLPGEKVSFVYAVHRIVAYNFVPNSNPDILVVVDHMDENKTNNRADNLRWVTSKENTQLAMSKPVYQLDRHTKKILQRFESGTAAAASVGGTTGRIGTCSSGRTPSYKGFCWKFVADYVAPVQELPLLLAPQAQ
jgi:hypothetical protein